MFLSLVWFEIKSRIFRTSSLIHFIIFFISSLFLALAFAGAFKEVAFPLGFSSKLPINAPVVLHTIIGIMNYFGILAIAPIFGQAISRDFETGFYQIIFSTRLTKTTYLLSRFFGAFFSSLLILSGIGLGLFAASCMPLIPTVQSSWIYYFSPYFSIVIPNLFICGLIFMAAATVSKKMAPVYVASIIMFTGHMIAQSIFADLDNRSFAALIEPFGMDASYQIFRYWSVEQQISSIVPISGILLWNRIGWISVSLFIFSVSYIFFNPCSGSKKRKKHPVNGYSESGFSLPEETKSSPKSIKILFLLTLSEFKQAFSNIYFLILLLCGVLYIFAVSGEISKFYGTKTILVTYQVLEVVAGSFATFIIIILSYYAGELVWKDREQKVHEMIDSKPTPNLYFIFSKFFCLILIQIFLIGVVMISCILIQTLNSYYNFEIGVYFKHLLICDFVSWLLYSIFSLFIHSISKNKQAGHTIFVTTLLLISWLPSFGLDHKLYLFGMLPKPFYSDMNQFGPFFFSWSIYASYWGVLHIALFVITILIWTRGEALGWRSRLRKIKYEAGTTHKAMLLMSLTAWISLGAYIFYNTNVLNVYKSEKQICQERADYENLYKPYEKMVHPKLVSVFLEIDVFPERSALIGNGIFKYQNTSNTPIETILVNIPLNLKNIQLEWNRQAKICASNNELGVQIYKLQSQLNPGEEMSLSFHIDIHSKGFTNQDFSKKIIENGTFFSGTDFFPSIGYAPTIELDENPTRQKFGLANKLRLPRIDDPIALQSTYLSEEGNWIEFEAKIGTSPDQIALAPGVLKKRWQENNRNYFHYKTEAPILPCYAFLSGRYQVYQDHWNGVLLEIYHHPSHTKNLARMMDSMKKSLTYYTKNFSPYQFSTLRIVEFPRYTKMAQSFPTMIPYSEGLGFIADIDSENPEDIDYPFYVTAHEVAHQWWGHQVVSGKVQGATMLSESLAQYCALMVMEKEYGQNLMKKFLKYELDQYLHGRSCEIEKELPLMLNENQHYIHYQKGSLAFYALKDYLGENTVNRILQDYIQKVSFQKPPFTKSSDLVQMFKTVAPPNLQQLISDLFETITLYENRIEDAVFRKKLDGKYEIVISTLCRKWRTDDSGKEFEITMNEPIDIGIFDETGNIRYLGKHPICNGLDNLVLEVDFLPHKIGIDPLNKLIDKNPADKILNLTPKMTQESCSRQMH